MNATEQGGVDAEVVRVMSLDAAGVDELHELIHTLVLEGAALGWLHAPKRGEVAALVRKVLAASEEGDACLLLARVGGDLAGFAYWMRREMETEAVHADIVRVAVSTAARGHGLGRQLVEAMIAAAEQAGIEILTLDVRGNNHAAMHLYERLGFVEYGRIRDFVAIGHERWDNIYMALDLRAHDSGLIRHGDAPQGPGSSRLHPD